MRTVQADLTATLENFRTEAAKRETRMLLAVIGMIGPVVAVLAAGFAFLGILIGLPS